MYIEWYFNGKLIKSANRIQTYHDFGYVALDIASVREEDSGTYTVVAKNALGEAMLNASMVVQGNFFILYFFFNIRPKYVELNWYIYSSPLQY